LEFRIAAPQIVAGKFSLLCHRAGQEAAAKRAVSQRRDAVAVGVRQHVAFDFALEHVVGRLIGGERCHRAEPVHLRRQKIADADGADFAGYEQILHRAGALFHRHVRIGPMHLIKIDDIGLQPAQRIVDFLQDAAATGVAERLAVLPVEACFGGDGHLRAPASQRRTDDLLGMAEAIDRRGVDQCDAAIDRGLNGAD
jgi:hypothetical protein